MGDDSIQLELVFAQSGVMQQLQQQQREQPQHSANKGRFSGKDFDEMRKRVMRRSVCAMLYRPSPSAVKTKEHDHDEAGKNN